MRTLTLALVAVMTVACGHGPADCADRARRANGNRDDLRNNPNALDDIVGSRQRYRLGVAVSPIKARGGMELRVRIQRHARLLGAD